MGAFEASADVVFADDNLASDASYSPPAGGTAIAGIRVIRRRPDDIASLGESRAVVGTVFIDVRASDVAAPEKGGIFTVADGADGESDFIILAKPERRGSRRLIWRCEAELA